MVDPASIVLGSVALLHPFFEACERLYHGYQISQAFGHDFVVIKLGLEAQHVRLQQLAKRRLRLLKGHDQLDPEDQNDPLISVVVRHLAAVKRGFEECNELVERYQKNDEPGQHAQKIEGDAEVVENTLTPSGDTSEATSTLVHDDPAGKHAKHSKRSILHRLHWGKTRHRTVPTNNKPVDMINMQPLTQMSGARSRSSLISSVQVEREYERQGQEGTTLQASVHFLRRVPWAYAHRKKLLANIDAIGRTITNLETFLMPWPIEKHTYQQPPSEEARSSSKVLLLVKGALTRLHEALMFLNEQTKDRQPFRLSIQLREDVDMSHQELAREPNVQLREHSFVFNIQRQREGDIEGASTLFFAETLIDVPDLMDRLQSEISEEAKIEAMDLTILRDLVAIPDTARQRNLQTTEPIKTWGYFRPPSNRFDNHVLFHDSLGQWSSPLDLADILAGNKYQRMMNPTQIIQLARLILISHLYFSAVRHSLAVDPRLSHYRFFTAPEEDIEIWDADEPLVLRPWLAFGFGSRAQRSRLGGSSGIAKAPNASLIELGLVLYQIGAGQTIEYGSGRSGLLKAKSNAMKELHKVDNLAGMTLTDVVQACLSPENLSSTGVKVEEKEETDFIITAISTLAKYEQHLEGTMSEAECQAIAGEDLDVHTLVTGAFNKVSKQEHAHAVPGANESGKDIKTSLSDAGAADIIAANGEESKINLALASIPEMPKIGLDGKHRRVEDVSQALEDRMLIPG